MMILQNIFKRFQISQPIKEKRLKVRMHQAIFPREKIDTKTNGCKAGTPKQRLQG